MRQTIKLENGDGWSVRGREIRGMNKTQVTYRFQDGLGMKNPRSAVFLPYDWNSRNQSKKDLLVKTVQVQFVQEEYPYF